MSLMRVDVEVVVVSEAEKMRARSNEAKWKKVGG